MEDLLEDEDEDFDKDDKVIMSRQASTKKKVFARTRTSSCAHHRGGLTYRKKHTATNTQTNKMTFVFLSLLSPPLCLAAQTLFAVIVLFLATS